MKKKKKKKRKDERYIENANNKMERIREVLVLKEEGYSLQQIAEFMGLNRRTIEKYLSLDFTLIHNTFGKNSL